MEKQRRPARFLSTQNGMGQRHYIIKKKLLLETDVLVDYLRGHSKAVGSVKSNSKHIVLSDIVVTELYAGTKDID